MFSDSKESRRVALYLRVSTEEQVDNGNGLQIQEDALRSYVAARPELSLNEAHIYRDEGRSGASKENRPALRAMFEAAARSEFDLVLIWKIDRFFRNLLFLLESVQALGKMNVGLISITQAFDTTGPFGNAMLQIVGVIAELERELIKERTNAGILQSMKKGRWARWHPPYGYIVEDGYLKIDEERAETVRLIFELFVEEKKSLLEISRFLAQTGAPTSANTGRFGESRKANLRHGNHWHKQPLINLLRNETYMGRLVQNRYVRDRKMATRVERPESEWIIHESPAIVSPDMFRRAQDRMDEIKTFHDRNVRDPEGYMLARLLHCGETGYKYVGYRTGKGNKNYRLNTAIGKTLEKIPSRSVSAEKIESAVWHTISGILRDPETFRRGTLSVDNEPLSREKTLQDRIRAVKTGIVKCQANTKILLSFVEEPSEDIRRATRERIIENAERIKELEGELANIEAELASTRTRQEEYEDVKRMAKLYGQNIDLLSYREKMEICRLLVEKIVVHGKRLEIHLIVPQDDGCGTVEEASIAEGFFDKKRDFLAGIRRMHKNTTKMRNLDGMRFRNVNGG